MPEDFLTESIVGASPFPSVNADGILRQGVLLAQSAICQRCGRHSCAEFHAASGQVATGLCHVGLGVVSLDLGNRRLVVNGLLTEESAAKLPRVMKKALQTHRVPLSQVVAWYTEMVGLMSRVKGHVDAEVKNSLDMLHDVQTACSSIIRNAEEFVDGLRGNSFEEKLEKLKPAELALIKGTQLLEARLSLMSLLSNPDAAKYGKKIPVPVYRAVDKLVRILRASAAKRQITLTISGGTKNTPRLYSSFETIPLVLIDNAIKYTSDKGQIDVVVEDVDRGVRLSVSSLTPKIPQEDRGKIFQRGFRSSSATTVASQGSGLGLHLASIVAEVHGTAIYHSEGDVVEQINQVDYCINEFHVTFL